MQGGPGRGGSQNGQGGQGREQDWDGQEGNGSEWWVSGLNDDSINDMSTSNQEDEMSDDHEEEVCSVMRSIVVTRMALNYALRNVCLVFYLFEQCDDF